MYIVSVCVHFRDEILLHALKIFFINNLKYKKLFENIGEIWKVFHEAEELNASAVVLIMNQQTSVRIFAGTLLAWKLRYSWIRLKKPQTKPTSERSNSYNIFQFIAHLK